MPLRFPLPAAYPLTAVFKLRQRSSACAAGLSPALLDLAWWRMHFVVASSSFNFLIPEFSVIFPSPDFPFRLDLAPFLISAAPGDFSFWVSEFF
jgi:hypothetical protein